MNELFPSPNIALDLNLTIFIILTLDVHQLNTKNGKSRVYMQWILAMIIMTY